MDSNFFLKIKDPQIDKDFILERNKDITKIASIAFVIRAIALIIGLINSFVTKGSFSQTYWIARSSMLLYQLVILLLSCKWPLVFSKYHSALLMPNVLITMSYVTSYSSYSQIAASIQAAQFFLIVCILMNNSWIPTAISMFLTVTALLIYYAMVDQLTDLIFIWAQISTLGLAIFASYQYEKRLKQQFLQLEQIKVMNLELRQIFNSLPEGIILINQQQNQVVLCNDEIRRLYKTSDQQELQDMISAKNLQHYDINKQSISMENNNNQQEQSLNLIEAAYQNPNNHNCFSIKLKQNLPENSPPLEASHEIITIKQVDILFQGCTHLLIVLKNLTSHVNYEKLKIQNQFYEVLTATVSHDLRTPLNSIIGLIGNMNHFIINDCDSGPSNPGKKYLQIIKNSSQFMLFLVNDLLDFFQIKNGKFKKNEKQVDIKLSLRNLIDMFAVGASEKGITLDYQYDTTLPDFVVTDEQRIKQVTLNLLQNALKFTLRGSISVHCSYDYANTLLKVSVEDTGIGIKPADREKLFKMFGKLDDQQNLNVNGIGLGLSICKQIVEAFDGDIALEESLIGSKFIFTIKCKPLPDYMKQDEINIDKIPTSNDERRVQYDTDTDLEMLLADELIENVPSSSTHIHFHNIIAKSNDLQGNFDSLQTQLLTKSNTRCCQEDIRILVVDDNIFNIVTLQTILEYEYNLKSDKALNGNDALQRIQSKFLKNQEKTCGCRKKRPYDVIFMDCSMPIMDGFEASQLIRQFELDNRINRTIEGRMEIVALTAYSTELISKQCIESGMDTIITKPIDTNSLSYIIENLKS